MRKDEIFYSLNINDIQTVALETINRKLTNREIKKVIEPISRKIPWYDVIDDAIRENVAKKRK